MSQLQDDNLNVSSSLASLSVRCSSQLQGLHYNVTRLEQGLARLEARQASLLQGPVEGQDVASTVAGEKQGVDRIVEGESQRVASPEGQGVASPAPLRKASQAQGNIGATLEGVGKPQEPQKDPRESRN